MKESVIFFAIVSFLFIFSIETSASPDTFGLTSIGSSSSTMDSFYIYCSEYPLTKGGTVTSMYAYTRMSTPTTALWGVAIYNVSETNIDYLQTWTSASIAGTTSWKEFNIPDIVLPTGSYFLCLETQAVWVLYPKYCYNSEGSYVYKYQSKFGFPSSFGTPTGTGSRSISIYATYTPDNEPPSYSNLGQDKTSGILSGDEIKFYSFWSDTIPLSHYIFSWNQSGSWKNDSAVQFPFVSSSWSNITKAIQAIDAGKIIAWKIYANDTNNNMAVTEEKSFYVSASPPASISIKKGWNLISMPYETTYLVTDNCGTASSTLYSWNANLRKWEKVIGLTKMQKTKGYWFYSSSGCTIEVTGIGGTISSEISLKKGWNMIGGTSDTRSLSLVASSCNLVQKLYYDSTTRQWATVSELKPYKAHWLYSNNDCQFI